MKSATKKIRPVDPDDALADLVRVGRVTGQWNLGFFSRPFLVDMGSFKGRIAKVYRPVASRILCDEVLRNHAAYVETLRRAGIRVPRTEIRLAAVGRRWAILVLQDAFRPEELVRGTMSRLGPAECEKLLGSLLADTLRFQSWKRRSGRSVGFHPTLRNYALRSGRLWYFDTFPPMQGWDQAGLNRIIIEFAPYGIFRFLRLFSSGWVDRVSNEYYRDDLMLTGLVGSSCRLRPEHAERLLAFSRRFLARNIPDSRLKRLVLSALERPPRLPAVWVFLRGLVGKEGKPNV